MTAYVVIERKPALQRQQMDRGGCELLRDGCGVEDRGRLDRHVMVQIGHAIAALEDDLALAHDGHRGARRSGLRPGIEQAVDMAADVPHAASRLRRRASGTGLTRRGVTPPSPDWRR